LAAAGLAALSGHRAWVQWSAESRGPDSLLAISGDDTATVPLAGALALVLLASWGVVLVSRRRIRRAVAGLGLVVAAAMVATAVLGLHSATSGLRDDLALVGHDDLTLRTTTWFWVYLVGAVLSVAAAALAVRWAPAWPEMGSRYDAPGAPPLREETDLDLWRALDDGRDPTLTDRRPPDP
jgi:uncharacterized membrane protein (TIGR02234 family)